MDLDQELEPADEKYKGKQVYYVQFESQRKKYIKKNCEFCGQETLVMLQDIKNDDSRGKYCSLSCVAKARNEKVDQSGENNPNYKGKHDYIRELKKEGECKHCGEDRPPALSFHHKEGEVKEKSVSRIVAEAEYSLEDVKREVKKCYLICFNCHQVLHSKNMLEG